MLPIDSIFSWYIMLSDIMYVKHEVKCILMLSPVAMNDAYLYLFWLSLVMCISFPVPMSTDNVSLQELGFIYEWPL